MKFQKWFHLRLFGKHLGLIYFCFPNISKSCYISLKKLNPDKFTDVGW